MWDTSGGDILYEIPPTRLPLYNILYTTEKKSDRRFVSFRGDKKLSQKKENISDNVLVDLT